MKTDDGYPNPLGCELFQQFLEILAIGGRNDDTAQHALVVTPLDVRNHVGVNVGVLFDLRLCEDRETDIAQSLDPGADNLRRARVDVGEHRGLGEDIGTDFVGYALGFVDKPFAHGVEARAVCGGRAGSKDSAEPHVQVRGVPHEQCGGVRLGGVVAGRGVLGSAHVPMPLSCAR